MKTVPGWSNQVGDSSRSEGSSATSKPKMGSHPCCILPIVVGVGTTIMFFVCYAIAVYNDHTVKNFPFISDTGVYPPERGIFTLSFNLSAFGGLVLMYLRYCYISQSDGPRKLNLFTFGCGILVCLGLMMVGAFQWSDMLYPHMVGAVMAFALGIVYIWLDTILSYKLQPLSTSVWAFRARLLVATLATVSGGVMFVFGGIIFSRDDYPYAVRLAAVGGEWALGIGLLVYIVTLCAEIRKVRRIAVVMDISGRFDVSNTHELRASRVIMNHDIPE
ncbi:DNA damage-regulated autophagy modulator protein 2-like isoform X2 [Branchiostoma floridae]|uniref:DNA damage-regulated autophagy modulator protein 2-like isoform X2 n=1 Tax=Branchiostoma floridae TaxID=7739 RepID=A0A9J7N7Y5_BRAFL|nr:DNA damage-regulated autophagy modulator protein 2-like isoform X2 [Branchiostoma floridae]